MCAMSQQILYGELFKDVEDSLTNIDDYAWGEELFEFPIIVYTKNRSTIPGYQRVCQEAVEVGLITIDPHAAGMIEVVPALYEPTNKRIYIKEDAFSKHWRHLKKSIVIVMALDRFMTKSVRFWIQFQMRNLWEVQMFQMVIFFAGNVSVSY